MSRRTWLVGICSVLAFAQTLAYYIYLRDDPGNYNGAGASGDQVAYIDLAQQVLHGTWQGAVHYMPGLPVVLALSQLVFGDPRLGIAVVQGLIFALMVVYASRLAASAFGDGASIWAAAAVALNPAIGYYAAQALTEFLTGAVLLLLAGATYRWALKPSIGRAALPGLLIGLAAYLRAEYLALAPIFGLILIWRRVRATNLLRVEGGQQTRGESTIRRSALPAIAHAAVLVSVTSLALAPWVVRYAVATGTPALYNESPFSNLALMGTWFRVFDEQTFSQLQQIETAAGSRDDAIARAATVGPRPELSQRYMEQARGPYERPLGETLALAAGNIQLNTRQYLLNHLVLAPVLIWAGHTPVRQADAPHLPASGRYAIWLAELGLLALALWQAGRLLMQGGRAVTVWGARRERTDADHAERIAALAAARSGGAQVTSRADLAERNGTLPAMERTDEQMASRTGQADQIGIVAESRATGERTTSGTGQAEQIGTVAESQARGEQTMTGTGQAEQIGMVAESQARGEQTTRGDGQAGGVGMVATTHPAGELTSGTEPAERIGTLASSRPSSEQTTSGTGYGAGLMGARGERTGDQAPRVVVAVSFLSIVAFLTVVHIVIAVDERFTTPALPLVGVFAAGRLAELVGARRSAAVRFAA